MTATGNDTEPAGDLEFNWVRPDLAVGGGWACRQAQYLAVECGFRRVVDLRAEACDDVRLLRRHGIELLRLPTPDVHPVRQEMLWTGVDWVRAGLERGDAYRLVQRNAMRAWDEERDFRALVDADPEITSRLDRAALANV